MKKIFLGVWVVFLVVTLGVIGCAKKAATSAEAIEQSKAKGSVQAQVDYLVSQANAFINGKNFDEAVKTAQYVLSNLDKDAQGAKDILEKAKAELTKTAQDAVKGLKDKLGSFGK